MKPNRHFKEFLIVFIAVLGIYVFKSTDIRLFIFIFLNFIFVSKIDYLTVFFILTSVLPFNSLDVNENYYTFISYGFLFFSIMLNRGNFSQNRLAFSSFILFIPLIIILFKGCYLSHAMSITTTIISFILISYVFTNKKFMIDDFKYLFFNILFFSLLIPYFLYYLNIDKEALVLTGYKGEAIEGGFARMGTEKLDASAIYFPCLIVFIYYITSEKCVGLKKHILSFITLIPCFVSYSFGFFVSFFLIGIAYLIYNFNYKLLMIYVIVFLFFITNKTVIEFYNVYLESKASLGALDSRTEVWELSINEIVKSPLLGSFSDMNIYIPVQYREFEDYGSHNILLEIGRRGGIFSIFSFFLFYFYRPMVKNNYFNFQSTLLLIVTMFYFVILHFYSNKVALFVLVIILYESNYFTKKHINSA